MVPAESEPRRARAGLGAGEAHQVELRRDRFDLFAELHLAGEAYGQPGRCSLRSANREASATGLSPWHSLRGRSFVARSTSLENTGC